MQASVLIATRIIQAIGTHLGADPAAVIEDLSDAVLAQVQAALAQVVGDGGVVLSADHTSVTVQAPSAGWLASNAAQQTLRGYIDDHRTKIAALYQYVQTQAAQFDADLTTAGQIIQAWIAGTTPTNAQVLVLIRVLIRIQVLNVASAG